MGALTIAILKKGTTIGQIKKAISEKYTEIEVAISSVVPDFISIFFQDGEDQRKLIVSFSNSCEKECGISGVWIALNKWGNSVEIAKCLCESFGGYLDEDNTDDFGFYPINILQK